MDEHAIERIAVVGAGLMGHGIALEFAGHGFEVALHDSDPVRLAQSVTPIAEGLSRMCEAGTLTVQAAAAAPDRLARESDLQAAVATADLIIEAVTEDLVTKQEIFAQLDRLAPHGAILASNSSSFMPSLLAAAIRRPEQVLVAHYFNPPHLLPLVELVRGNATSDETITRMRSLYLAIGKHPVVVEREIPGFIGNRLQMALLREALALVESGIASPSDVDTVIRTGFGRRLPFAGVFEIFDAAGWDVTLAVAEQLFPEIDQSHQPPASLRDRVARGALGIKAGRGFYEWTPEEAAALRQRIGSGVMAVARLGNS